MNTTAIKTTKLAGIAGLTWAGANLAAGFSTGEPPKLDAAGAEITDYLADSRSLFLVAVAVFAATLPLMILFTGELRRRTREGGNTLASSAIAPATSVLLLGYSLAYTLLLPFIFGDGLGTDASDGLLRYAYVLTFAVSMIGNIGGAAVIAAASMTQGGAARTASQAVAAILAISSVAGLVNADIARVSGLGFAVVALWTVFVGVGMVRDRGTVHRTVAAAA